MPSRSRIARRRSIQDSIRDHAGEALLWVEVNGIERTHALRAGGVVVGLLYWKDRLAARAVAESAEGEWTFERRRSLGPRVTVRAPGSAFDQAELRMNWKGGGVLQVLDGRRYHWSNTSLWNSSWAFSTDGGELLLAVFARPGSMRGHSEVRIEQRAVALDDLPFLVLLGGYLHVLSSDDAARAAGR